VLFYLSKWYTREELNLRMAFFYSGSLISGAFGNLIAAGILNGLAGKSGMAAWQWLYVIEGVITVGVGAVVCFALPDFPHTWRLLSESERAVASRRLALDAAEADADIVGGNSGAAMPQLQGLKLAFMYIRTYILALAHVCMIGAISFQNFFPTLVGTLGYSHVKTLLLAAPPYLFITFYSYGHGLMADRLKNRFW
jgi:MFS family permease